MIQGLLAAASWFARERAAWDARWAEAQKRWAREGYSKIEALELTAELREIYVANGAMIQTTLGRSAPQSTPQTN
jgi:hypothetical protein